MKKAIITIAIVLGLGLTSFGDPNGGGLFQRGTTSDNGVYGNRENSDTPMLPNHGLSDNQNANAPLGTGIAVLAVLGGAYLIGKRRKQD